MDDRGQMILLAALAACICLMVVVACVEAVQGTAYGEDSVLTPDLLANVRWAQENALQKTAHNYSSYPWDSRAAAVSGFKDEANVSMDSLAQALLNHGIACRFSYNDSLGSDYADLHPDNETCNMGGIVVEKNGGSARIRGCACDMTVEGYAASYRISQVVVFDS